MSNEKWINGLVQSFRHTLTSMDVNTCQPLNFLALHALYSQEWIGFLNRMRKKQKEKKISIKKMAELFPNASATSTQLLYLMNDVKTAQLPKEERLELIEWFYSILKHQRVTDPLCLKRQNIQWNPSHVKAILRKTKFQTGNPENARKVGQLYLAASHLVNGLYTDIYTDFGIEVHGPYDVSKKFGKNHFMSVTDLINLKPVELFDQAAKIKANHIQIIRVFENVKLVTEMVSCHFTYKGNPMQGLRKYAVIVDGKNIGSISKAQALQRNLETNASKQWEYLTSHSTEQLKQLMLLQRSFLFKRVADALGMNWRPPANVKKMVKGKSLSMKPFAVPKAEAARKKYWTKFLDPRIDFFPGSR